MDTTGWTTWNLPDPHLGMPVLGLRHPPGWAAQGNVTWVAEHNESPEHHWFQDQKRIERSRDLMVREEGAPGATPDRRAALPAR